jgi:hypothetical protein
MRVQTLYINYFLKYSSNLGGGKKGVVFFIIIIKKKSVFFTKFEFEFFFEQQIIITLRRVVLYFREREKKMQIENDYLIMASFPIYTHQNNFETMIIPRKLNILIERYYNSKRFNNDPLDVTTYFMCWIMYDMINILDDGNLEKNGLSTQAKNDLPKDYIYKREETFINRSILEENVKFISDIWSKMSEDKQRIMLRNSFFI